MKIVLPGQDIPLVDAQGRVDPPTYEKLKFAFDTISAITEAARFDKSGATSGQTGLLLWDFNSGTIRRVSVGAADSGGTGFKVLRIPN